MTEDEMADVRREHLGTLSDIERRQTVQRWLGPELAVVGMLTVGALVLAPVSMGAGFALLGIAAWLLQIAIRGLR